MNLVSLTNISKSLNGKVILKDINLNIEYGSFVSIFGPNAAGKTTLLNLISGLLIADSGQVTWADVAAKNKVSYVFQNYRETLFPWKHVWENIALPLKLNGESQKECKEKVMHLVKKFAIDIDLEKYPYQLSGGQQQLVAILRAIITNPILLLLDEPFSALDFARRLELQQKVLEIWQEIKATIVFVSHDLDEAIYLADKVILLGDKPTRIIVEQMNQLPRPRETNILTSSIFSKLKNELLDPFINTSIISGL